MIFLQLHYGGRIIILEPNNMEKLQEGGYVTLPDKMVQILYSPDAKWLGDEIAKRAKSEGGYLDAEILSTLHKESMGRAPVKDYEYHPTETLIDNRKPEDKPN